MAETPIGAAARRRLPAISRDDVVRGGLVVARRVGLANLTMALLGEELNVTPMAAYRHVANKQELCDLVLDAVLTRVAVPPASSGDWMHRLTVMHADVRREVASVRGAVEAIRHRGDATPELMRLAEGVMAILSDAGFGRQEAGIAFNVIHAYMSGQYDLDNGNADRARTGVGAISSSSVAEVLQATDDEIFAYGFETVLLGLRARLEASRRPGSTAT